MSQRTVVTIAAAAALGLAVLVPTAARAWHHPDKQAATLAAASPSAGPSDSPSASPSPDPSPSVGETVSVPANVDFDGDFLGWALLDNATGQVTGENLTKTSSTESMVKTWIVADFLRRSTSEKGGQPTAYELMRASAAIRNSDDNAAEELYEDSGGDDQIERMIQMCGLRDTKVYPGWWSRTQMSPRDAVQLGQCLADGTAAGPRWTSWLLTEMRSVKGSTASSEQHATYGGGRWGIIDAVSPEIASTLAIKNGWTAISSDDNWHLNCLAISDTWTMSVMMRYPIDLGLDYGADTCAAVASSLLTPTLP